MQTAKSIDKQERLAWLQRRRENHHKALETLALTVGCNTNGLTLWRQLRRVENWAADLATAYCNGAIDTDHWQSVKDLAKVKLAKIFNGSIPQGVYVNADARGHAIKLDCDEAKVPEGMERDWGGNGILAAEID